MKMDKAAGSGNDEFYTPVYAIEPILKYLRLNSLIWCPFDTKESNFHKVLLDAGHSVVSTHIDNGQDFLKEDIPYPCIDYIISNPPYSIKTEVLEKLFRHKKPFAMLVGLAGLFESQKRFNLFRENEFEIMYLNKRVSYFDRTGDICTSINPPFPSVYICHDILPSQIVFEEINKKREVYETNNQRHNF